MTPSLPPVHVEASSQVPPGMCNPRKSYKSEWTLGTEEGLLYLQDRVVVEFEDCGFRGPGRTLALTPLLIPMGTQGWRRGVKENYG